MKDRLHIIKIGGTIVDSDKDLKLFLDDFSKINEPKILVHGGGKVATKMSQQLGIETKLIDGRRITSEENLKVVTMVYAGLINKNITAKLQSFGCNAIGLSGADVNSILAQKRKVKSINYGWVGDIETINSKTIQLFIENNITPIFCAISHDKKGNLLNTNADTIAAEIAIAMSSDYDTQLTYCFEKKGVLKDVNDDNSVIPFIDKKAYHELKVAKVIDKGMLPKMENCFHALENRVSKVVIGNNTAIKNEQHTSTTLIL